MKFRRLSLLLVRPWFNGLWFTGWAVSLFLVSLGSVYFFPLESWSVLFWVRAVVNALVCYLVFFAWGGHLRRQGKNYLAAQRLDNDRMQQVG